MKNEENAKCLRWGVTAAAVIAFALVLYLFLYRTDGVAGVTKVLGGILRPFIYGAIIAYLVAPLCRRLERVLKKAFRGKRDALARSLSITISVVFAVLVVAAVLLLIIPQLIESLSTLLEALPAKLEALRANLTKMLQDDPELQEQFNKFTASLSERVAAFFKEGGMAGVTKALGSVGSVAGSAFTTVTGVFGVLFDLLIGLIVALYILSRREQLAAQASMIVQGLFKPSWAEWIRHEVRFTDRMFNGFFMGKLVDSAIVGVICFIGCLLMGFKSALLIAVIVGVTNIIPFFGPYIGAIPCALLLLIESPMQCVMFVVFIILLQQLDGNVIGPRILGDSTGLSALWVMFGILLFGGLWGIAGMLVGVPLMAVIYDIIRQITFNGLRRRGKADVIDRYNARFHPPVAIKRKKKG